MMQKRTVYSLLLISFILVFAFNLSAQTVLFESKSSARCESSALNISVDPGSDVSAVEVVFEVSSASGGAFFDALNVTWDPGMTVLTNRIVDLSGVDNISPDTVRIAAMLIDAGDACLSSGQTVIAQVQFTTNDVCAGEVYLDGASVTCNTVVSTQIVDCATSSVAAAAVTSGAVVIANNDPTIAAIGDATIHWGDTYTETAVGSDLDEASCESLTYSLLTYPDGMTINASTGAISWPTNGDDVCTHSVEVQVEDACGSTASTSFTICVENTPPELTCPDPITLCLGDELALALDATDPDGGPGALVYELVDFDGPGSVVFDGAAGTLNWVTLFDESYRGTFNFTVAVNDGAALCDPCSPSNADTCSFEVTISNFLVEIQRKPKVIQGQEHDLEISGIIDLNPDVPGDTAMGGFDFLIQYDPSALSFQYASPGAFLDGCTWEYFTYRYGESGNCAGSACPTGILRIVAIAETNNGPYHPDCFSTEGGFEQLAVLRFLVTNDRTFECMYAPVRFIWYDCGDNTISSVDGNRLFLSKRVFNHEDTLTGGIYSQDLSASVDFPSAFGANDDCDVSAKAEPLRFISFVNGGFEIVCADSIDGRGDLNLNDILNEIADAVLYTNYFVYGLGVFTNPDAQIAASDVNADGLSLSVADLVYLIRIVIGDAQPYPKEVVAQNISYVHDDGKLSIQSDIELGAAALVVEGNVVPELLAENMEIKYNYDGANTRILVYSLEGNSFSGDMVNVGAEIVSIEMADSQGLPVTAKWVPSSYALMQNYPNPFNPTTTISFMLPSAADFDLTIYNVNGQKVETISGSAEVGVVDLEWDASNMASGVYFYRLNAGSFTDVKKMVLLK